MSSTQPKHLSADAYDHLWSLLPVMLAFLAVIVFAAAADERPVQAGPAITFEALPALTIEESRSVATDVSVPPASDAMARLPGAVGEPVATF